MASNRHLGRIIALQTLYELEFRRDSDDASIDLEEILSRNITRYASMVDDKDFIRALVDGILAHQDALDKQIAPLAPERPIKDIMRMDRAVLRMGAYELQHQADVPHKVVINEAVELAKAFGGDNSSKFVNGVLGSLLKQTDPEAAAKNKPPTTKEAKA